MFLRYVAISCCYLCSVADLFRGASPRSRPESLTQDDEETEDDINIENSDEENVTNEVDGGSPPRVLSAKFTADALLPAYQQGSGQGMDACKKPSGRSGSSKRLKRAKASLPSVIELGDDGEEIHAPSRIQGS